MAFINPLDLEMLLINTFAGSGIIFALLSLVIILIVGIKWKMKLNLIGIIILFWSLIIARYEPNLLYISVIILGLIIAKAIRDIIEK